MLINTNYSTWTRIKFDAVKELVATIALEDIEIGKDLHLLYASPKDIVNQFK